MVKPYRLRRGIHAYLFVIDRTTLCEHSILMKSFFAEGELSFFTFFPPGSKPNGLEAGK